jgi:Fe-S oxidoreductase
MARRAGNEYLAQMMIQENAAVLNQYQPKRILAGCPHCYNTLKHEYPQFGARFEVVHTTEFVLQLFRQGRLSIASPLSSPAVFHDSCYLGRWNGIFGAPRELLGIITGEAPRELRRSADKGLCCGAGGGRMFMEEKIGKRINAERVEDILASGTALTAAACPFCITMLRDGLADCGSKVEVKDIVELVDIATG